MSSTENVITIIVGCLLIGAVMGMLIMEIMVVDPLRRESSRRLREERRRARFYRDLGRVSSPGVRRVNGESFYSSEWLNDGGGRQPLVPVSKHLSVVDEVPV